MLRYETGIGRTAQRQIDQASRTGGTLPEAILNAPKLHLGLSIYYEGFWRLSAHRGQAFSGVARISLSDVLTYATFYRFSDYQTHFFIRCVQELDRVLIQQAEKDAKR